MVASSVAVGNTTYVRTYYYHPTSPKGRVGIILVLLGEHSSPKPPRATTDGIRLGAWGPNICCANTWPYPWNATALISAPCGGWKKSGWPRSEAEGFAPQATNTRGEDVAKAVRQH